MKKKRKTGKLEFVCSPAELILSLFLHSPCALSSFRVGRYYHAVLVYSVFVVWASR